MLRTAQTPFFARKRFNLLASTFALATLTVAASAPASATVVAASPLATVSRQHIHGLAGRGMDLTGLEFTAYAVETPGGIEMGFFNVVTPDTDFYGGTLNSVYVDGDTVYASGVITEAIDGLTAMVGSGFAFQVSNHQDKAGNAWSTRSTFMIDPTGPTDGFAEEPALRTSLDESPHYRFIRGYWVVID